MNDPIAWRANMAIKFSRKNEITAPAAPFESDSHAGQTHFGADDYDMASLEAAVIAQDVMMFHTLVDAIGWSKESPADLVKAVRWALALEAPLIARKLAEQGAKLHPTHPEIKKMAQILAAPTVVPANPPAETDVKANQIWIKAHREAYRQQWVALRNGELITSEQTFSALIAKVGDIKGKGILITQVT